MHDTPEHKAVVEAEIEIAYHQHHDVSAGYEDPHKAALEDNPGHTEQLSLSVSLWCFLLSSLEPPSQDLSSLASSSQHLYSFN